MRIVALLLAIVMMAGTATQVCAAPGIDVAAAVDDGADVAAPSFSEPVAVARPDHRAAASIEAPEAPPSRAHAVLIFRPPR
jgi:hypothetical protein